MSADQRITLVLGGTRSGKSEVAESLCARGTAPVTYLATGDDSDPDLAARIAGHVARRPHGWATVEVGARLVEALGEVHGTVLVDSLGAWVAATPDFAVDPVALVGALADRPGETVIVSEEVGLGVHPSTEAGRRFADVLGTVNRAVAASAEHVLLVVAGRVLALDEP